MHLEIRIDFRISILILLLYACKPDEQEQPEPELSAMSECVSHPDSCGLSLRGAEMLYQLTDAYEQSCRTCLQSFLDRLAAEYESSTTLKDSLSTIYEVFNLLYTPWDVSGISDEITDPNGKTSYYFIDSVFFYDFHLNGHDKGPYYAINGFRPPIKNDTAHLILAEPDLYQALNCFLGADRVDATHPDGVRSVCEEEESDRRVLFIEQVIKPYRLPHFSRLWVLETVPEISYISFNEKMDSAKVFYFINDFWEALVVKDHGEWEIRELLKLDAIVL